jgi:hypothetical protein
MPLLETYGNDHRNNHHAFYKICIRCGLASNKCSEIGCRFDVACIQPTHTLRDLPFCDFCGLLVPGAKHTSYCGLHAVTMVFNKN